MPPIFDGNSPAIRGKLGLVISMGLPLITQQLPTIAGLREMACSPHTTLSGDHRLDGRKRHQRS